jgi:hypothetical protein
MSLFEVFGLAILNMLVGWLGARFYYQRIINAMTQKNIQLGERVKKAERIILNEVLQFSPDDIELLKKNIEKGVTQKEK